MRTQYYVSNSSEETDAELQGGERKKHVAFCDVGTQTADFLAKTTTW